MKIFGGEANLNLMLNNSIEFLKERMTSKMEPIPSKVPTVSSPNKQDCMAELENMIRLIRRGHAKDKKNSSKANDSKTSLKTLENASKHNNYPVDPLAIPAAPMNLGKDKPSDGSNSDMVEVLRQMLDKALQALKICQSRITEANKRHEASQLEIQKLQDEVRNLRAQINPPQLQLMKGLSSLSMGNKRRRLRSPSSSGSTSRSTSSSRNHSSRRSESPPQLSPAFIPRPTSASVHVANSNKRSRYNSPHSFVSESNESNSDASNIFNHDIQLEDAQFPDSGKTMNCNDSGTASKDPALSDGLKLRFRNLKSNMKNTSHLSVMSTKHPNSVKGRSSSLYSFKKVSQDTTGGAPQSLLSTTPCTNSSGVMKFNKNKTPVRTYGNTRSSSASRVHQGANTSSNSVSPQTPSLKSNSVFTGKIARNVNKLSDPEPPVLENHAESESEEEFDAFTFAKNDDDDESEELIDIDELPEIPPPALPPPKSAHRRTTGLLSNFQSASPSNSSFKFSLTQEGHSRSSESLKMPDIRSSASMPSSPISSIDSIASSKSCRILSKSSAGLRKFRSSTLSSRAASSIHGMTSKLLKSRPKLRENRHSYPMVRKFRNSQEQKPSQATLSPFPPRQFDKRIDYSSYLNGNSPLDSNSVVVPEEDDADVIKDEADAPSTSKSITTRKGIREILERFSMRLDGSENCMMAQIPYQFYESETTYDPVDGEDESFKPEKKDASLVEIPRWRERIFEPFDTNVGQATDESLDDQVFLKRHTKSEINERRRKRWDSQRMREESYLEKLKRKREERENQKKHKKKRGRGQQNDKNSKDDDIFTFQPLIHDAVYIRNDPELPITVFGYPLPIIESEEFELPWTVPTKPAKSPKKTTEANKITTPSSKISGLKTALRQSKR
ncbi:unnamed protein product [Allacma fusca]|uniref:PEHE domain-containing protein n=1 Tax=Allacma fusca TaxID=39272 RepID=A0A8J2LQW1_9HEXA|nr:unnamed protein product [Allacma fusca]